MITMERRDLIWLVPLLPRSLGKNSERLSKIWKPILQKILIRISFKFTTNKARIPTNEPKFVFSNTLNLITFQMVSDKPSLQVIGAKIRTITF